MAIASASLPRARALRLRPAIRVALLCAAAGGLYAWMRLPVARDMHAHFSGWCDRLAMQPQDWPCRPTGAQTIASYVGGSLLIGLAVALPGVVLAASGRRLSALVPAVVAGLATAAMLLVTSAERNSSQLLFGINESLLGGGNGRSYWRTHGEIAIFVDLLLVSVPALAIAFVLRPARRPRPARLPRHAAGFATFVVGAAVVGFRLAWFHLPYDIFMHSVADTWTSAAMIAVFAAMLGTDRRFWPWAIAPVAVLLSLGPTMAIMSIPSPLTAFSWFASAVPLAAVGLVASFWRPIAMRVAGRRPELRSAVAVAPRTVRPTVVLNALAAVLLVLSVVAQRTDPLPIQISIALPTYLGERQVAEDVRTKLNLGEGLGAMEAYRAEHGTYVGFDAAAGESAAPTLAWNDGPTERDLVVGVTVATDARAQLVARSGSGAAFCIQALADPGGATVTYGSSDRGRLREARAGCGSTPWTPAATRMFDVGSMCDGVDDQVILICRAVQRLIRRTLSTSLPA